jgi:hypothetical protein
MVINVRHLKITCKDVYNMLRVRKRSDTTLQLLFYTFIDTVFTTYTNALPGKVQPYIYIYIRRIRSMHIIRNIHDDKHAYRQHVRIM